MHIAICEMLVSRVIFLIDFYRDEINSLQYPGRARQSSYGTAGTKFTKPRTKNKSHLCRVACSCWVAFDLVYRDHLKDMQILLSRTQAGITGKQEQEQTSRKHVQAF